MESQQHHPATGMTTHYKAVPTYGYRSKLKSFWKRILFQRHSFEDNTLERLYKVFVYKLQLCNLKCLVVIGILITTLLCVLNFVFVSGITLENICYIILCVLFVCVLIFLHTHFMKPGRLYITCLVILVIYVCLAVISLPVNFSNRPFKHYTPADGLWLTLFTVFVVYLLLPLRVYILVLSGLLLSVAHTLVAIFLTETYEWLLWRQRNNWDLWKQITANILLLLFVQCIGVFVCDKTECALRKVFSECRSCVSARIEAEDESEKLERLLCSVLPHTTAKEVKQDILSVDHQSDNQLKPYIQTLDNVSLLYANIIGLTELSSQCTASELVTILNHVFGKLDSLANENHCTRYRILGDVYFCTSGLPDARPDHAKCCVDLAIEIIDVLREIREGTELELYTKIGIHTGSVTCGIVGSQRWCFEVFGHDVQLGKEVMLACLPGKVLISKPTFEYLQGEYDVEPANVWNRSEYLRDRKTETYYVIASQGREPMGLFKTASQSGISNQNRHSYRNMSSVIASLQEGLVPNAEVPFLPIVQGPELEKLEKEIESCPYQSSRSVNNLQLDKVQRYLTQSVMSGSSDKNRSDWVNIFTLRYHHGYKEKRYHKQEDTSFSTTMLCSLLLLVLVAATQAVVLPRTLLLLCFFLLCFTWIAIVLIVFLGAKLRCIDCELLKSLAVRLTLMITTVLLMYIVGQINVLCCRGGITFPSTNVTKDDGILAFNREYHLSCDMPYYIPLSGVMAITFVAVFIRTIAVVKLVLMVIMSVGYFVVLEWTHAKLFTRQDSKIRPDLPSHVQGLLMLSMFSVAVYIQGRLMEWVLRLGFLWKDQAMEERIAVTEFQNHVRQLVINMLPSHVATHFVDFTGLKHSLSMYSHTYPRVGVCCTSIPNYLDHFRGTITLGNVNNNNNDHMQGMDAFRVLNELINKFDELLSEDRFRDVDKVRSFGHGYQVTVGLVPERPILESSESIGHQLTLLIEFVYAMQDKIQSFNAEKGTDLKLRSGVTLGPISVGVVGARRPLFDLWGFTMYLANLMEASGKVGCIQVTEDVLQPLTGRYEFQPRGPLYLNGRGELATYYITGRKVVDMPAQSTYGANLPLKKTPENWKRLSHDAPHTAGIKPSLTERTSHEGVIQRSVTATERGVVPGDNTSSMGPNIVRIGSQVSEKSFDSYHSLQNGGNGQVDRNSYASKGDSPRSQRSLTNIQRQNSNESNGPTAVYGIRIQGIQQRNRIPSDDSAVLSGKTTMTPPSSLSRKRKDSSGTLQSLSRNNSGAGLLAPPTDPNVNRMASPDLPLVHYQRGAGSQNSGGNNNHTLQKENTLTQSQILNPAGEPPDVAITTRNILQGSPHSNGSSSNNLVVTPRRSHTQTPSSNRSSAETIGSVISVHVLDSPNNQIQPVNGDTATYSNNTPPRNNSSNTPPRNNKASSPLHGNMAAYGVGNLPKIEESNRESRSYTSSKDSLDNIDDCKNKNRNSRTSYGSGHDFLEVTGSEIAEMDNILRELGCGAGGNQPRLNDYRQPGSSQYSGPMNNNHNIVPNHPNKHHQPLNNLNISNSTPINSNGSHKQYSNKKPNIITSPVSSNLMSSLTVSKNMSESDDNSSIKTKTMSSDHGTQISEYENDDLLVQSGPVSSVEVKNAPKVSLLQKRNSLPLNNENSVTKDGSCQTKLPLSIRDSSRGQSLPKEHNASVESKSQSISTQTSLSSKAVPPSGSNVNLKPHNKPAKGKKDYMYMYRPLQQSSKSYMASSQNNNDDSSSCSSSIYGIPKLQRVRVGLPEADSPPPLPPPPSDEAMMSLERRIHEATAKSHHQPAANSHHHQVYHLPPNYRQPLFGNSAFRPVAPNRSHMGYYGGPVIRGPNMGFVGAMGGGGSRQAIRPIGVRIPYYSGMYPSRRHCGPPSSNTSEENAAIFVPPPRRKPTTNKQSSGLISAANEKHGRQSHDSSGVKSHHHHSNKNTSKSTSASSSVSEDKKNKSNLPSKQRHHSEGNQLDDQSTDDTLDYDNSDENRTNEGRKSSRPPAPPFQIKRRQPHQQPIRKCRSLDYIPSDIDETTSLVSSSRAESPSCEYTTNNNATNRAYMPITELIKNHIIGGDNISLSSLESGSEMSRSEPDLNYDSSTTAYESEYDNYRPGMASDEDYFVPEPVSDVELGMFDDIDLEEVTVSDQYNVIDNMAELIGKNTTSGGKKVITQV